MSFGLLVSHNLKGKGRRKRKARPWGPAFWRKGRYALQSTCGSPGCGRIRPGGHAISLVMGRLLSSGGGNRLPIKGCHRGETILLNRVPKGAGLGFALIWTRNLKRDRRDGRPDDKMAFDCLQVVFICVGSFKASAFIRGRTLPSPSSAGLGALFDGQARGRYGRRPFPSIAE